jgi:transposase-like protein
MDHSKNTTNLETARKHLLSHVDILNDFTVDFLSEAVCRVWVLTEIHKDVARCPGCGIELAGERKLKFWANERICCGNCGKFFTALTDTFLSGCHLSFRQIILLAVFLGFNIPGRIIADKVGITEESVRLWRHKFNAIHKVSGN